MVGIPTVDAPDPFGRIRIRYNTSRPDVRCLCRIVGLRLVDCSAMEYTSDPRVLGGGDHTLSITCMDEDGYADNKLIKFSLSLPPTPREHTHTTPPPTHTHTHTHTTHTHTHTQFAGGRL